MKLRWPSLAFVPSRLAVPFVFAVATAVVLEIELGALPAFVFLLATSLSIFSIDLGWDDEINAAFPLLVASTQFMTITVYGLVFASFVVVNVVARQATRVRETYILRDLTVWTAIAGVGLFAIWFERSANLYTLDPQPARAAIQALAVPTVCALVIYHAFTDLFRRQPASWRSRFSADAAIWSFTLAIAAGYRQSGLQLLVGLSLVPLVLWYAFRRLGLARLAQEEAVGALALMPEITEFSSYGHGRRSAVYADAVCRAYRMAPEARERIVQAIQIFRLGFLTYPSPDEFDDETEIPTRDNLAKATADVIGGSRFLNGVPKLTTEVIRGEKLSREAAIVAVVSDFDDYVGNEVDFTPIALQRLGERYSSGYEVEVIGMLEKTIKRDPTLLERAREAGSPVIEAARRAEEEIAADNH